MARPLEIKKNATEHLPFTLYFNGIASAHIPHVTHAGVRAAWPLTISEKWGRLFGNSNFCQGDAALF